MTTSLNTGGTYKSLSSCGANIGGTWKTVNDIFVNIGGTWKPVYSAFTGTYLYNLGSEEVSLTGGYTAKTENGTTVTKNAGDILIQSGTSSLRRIGAAYTTNKIDLTSYTSLKILCDTTLSGDAVAGIAVNTVVPTNVNYADVGYVFSTPNSTQTGVTLTLNVTSFNGLYYVYPFTVNAVGATSNSINKVYKIWLE